MRFLFRALIHTIAHYVADTVITFVDAVIDTFFS